MKIAFNGRFLGRQVTGVERVALETLRALHSAMAEQQAGFTGLEVAVLLPSAVPAPEGFPLFAFRHVGQFNGHAWEQFELPRALRAGEVLVSLCNTSPIAVKRQVVVIHDAATVAAPAGYSWTFRTWYKAMIAALMHRAAIVATVSQFSKNELIRFFGIPKARLAVLTEGIDHMKRSMADTAIINKHKLHDKPFVLAVSSQQPNKNFGLLIEAVAMLESPPFDVVIVGGSGHAAFASKSIAQPDFVKNLGYVSDAELIALYGAATCFVFPSVYEGFGLPPVEAMAVGCPVLSSSAASLPEVCGEAALYFAPDKPKELLAHIQLVMGDSQLRARMRGMGLDHVQNMTWRRTAMQVLDLVKSI